MKRKSIQLFLVLFCFGAIPFLLLNSIRTEQSAQCIAGSKIINPTPVLDTENFNYSQFPFSKGRPVIRYEPTSITASSTPLVSVITAFYNPKVFTAPECVLGQSLQQIEWIIVDDASTTGLELLEPYRHLPNVVVLTIKKSYLPGARNAGIKVARAPYVFFFDTDDYIEATYLEKAYWLLETNKHLAMVNAYSVGFGYKEYLWTHGFQDGSKNLEENQITVALMARKDIVTQVGGFDETLIHGMEDWDLWLRILNHSGFWGYTIQEFLFWYRVSPPGKWLNIDSPEKMNNFKKELRRKYPSAYSKQVPRHALNSPPYFSLVSTPPSANILQKHCNHLLIILSFAAIGGADQFNFNLLKALVQLGWDITIVVIYSGEVNKMLPHYRRLTPDVFVLQEFLSFNEHPSFLAYLINSRSPTITLITNAEAGYLYLEYLKTYAPNTIYIDYCHSEEEWKQGGYPRFSVQNSHLLDRSLFASQHLLNWVLEKGHDPQKVAVVHVGVDTEVFKRNKDDFSTIRAQFGMKHSTMVISYVARLVEGKLPFVFSGLMKRLQMNQLDFFAFVIGDGPLKKRLENELKSFGVDSRVKILGSMHNDQVRRYLSASDVIVLPSTKEGISLSLMEGMAMGLVPLSMNIGGQRELVLPTTGFLVEPSEREADIIAAFEKHINLLYRNRTLLAQMSQAAVERVRSEFSIETMTQNMIKQFQLARERKDNASGKEVIQPSPHLLENTRIATEYIRLQEEANALWKTYTNLLEEKNGESQIIWNVLEAEWNQGIRLHAIKVSPTAKVKGYFMIAFLWSSNGAINTSYRLFVHFKDGTNTAFQGDRFPTVNGVELLTNTWKQGVLLEDSRLAYVPEEIKPNKSYSMVIGWFDEKTGERLKIKNIGGTNVSDQDELQTGLAVSILGN